MISRFFSNTKPISFIFICVFSFFSLWLNEFLISGNELNFENILKFFWCFGVVLIYFYTIRFICFKDRLFENNSFILFFNAILIALFCVTYKNLDLLVISILSVIIFHKLFFLKDLTPTKKDIFDSSFILTICGLIYNWAFLLLLMPIMTVLLYMPRKVRNLLVCLMPPIFVGIVLAPYFIVNGSIMDIQKIFLFKTSMDISVYCNGYAAMSILISGVILLFSIIYSNIITVKIKEKIHFMVYLFIFLELIIIYLYPYKNGGEFILVSFPISLIITESFSKITILKFRDIFLWTFIGLVIVVFGIDVMYLK